LQQVAAKMVDAYGVSEAKGGRSPMDGIRDIQAEQGWTDETLLDLVLRFTEAQGRTKDSCRT
jgi:hypothetical protein